MTDLEKKILTSANAALGEAIESELVGYNKPLSQLANQVINEHSSSVKQIMSKAFNSVVKTPEFEKSVHNEFNRKVAKLLVAQLSGEVEKAVNAVRQDPTLKARMILAIEEIVNKSS